MSDANTNIARTLSILRELAQGKRLTLPDVGTLAMGTDMTVGFALVDAETGAAFIAPMSELTLSQLNDLLTKHEIGYAVPDQQRR